MQITYPFFKYSEFRTVIYANLLKPLLFLKYSEFRPVIYANQLKPLLFLKYSEFRPGIHANQVKRFFFMYFKKTRKSKGKKLVNGINDLVEMCIIFFFYDFDISLQILKMLCMSQFCYLRFFLIFCSFVFL